MRDGSPCAPPTASLRSSSLGSHLSRSAVARSASVGPVGPFGFAAAAACASVWSLAAAACRPLLRDAFVARVANACCDAAEFTDPCCRVGGAGAPPLTAAAAAAARRCQKPSPAWANAAEGDPAMPFDPLQCRTTDDHGGLCRRAKDGACCCVQPGASAVPRHSLSIELRARLPGY